MTAFFDDWIRLLCFGTPEGLMAQTAISVSIDSNTAG